MGRIKRRTEASSPLHYSPGDSVLEEVAGEEEERVRHSLSSLASSQRSFMKQSYEESRKGGQGRYVAR